MFKHPKTKRAGKRGRACCLAVLFFSVRQSQIKRFDYETRIARLCLPVIPFPLPTCTLSPTPPNPSAHILCLAFSYLITSVAKHACGHRHQQAILAPGLILARGKVHNVAGKWPKPYNPTFLKIHPNLRSQDHPHHPTTFFHNVSLSTRALLVTSKQFLHLGLSWPDAISTTLMTRSEISSPASRAVLITLNSAHVPRGRPGCMWLV